MLTVFGALAQLERDCIRQRAEEGMLIAKQEGRLKGFLFAFALDSSIIDRRAALGQELYIF